MIAVEAAVAAILAAARPLGAETVALPDADGRVLAEAIRATRQLPPWDNSAMDGFAVRAADAVPGCLLPVSFTVGAGDAPRPLAPGTAARIMTGAPVPAGADAIVMREDAVEEGGAVRFTLPSPPAPGAHVRGAGEDVARGDQVLGPADRLGPGEVGLVAALGRTLVSVHRRPRVAIVSTGSELVDADRPPGPDDAGKIVGSNGWALAAQCRAAGALPTVLPLVRDDRDLLRATFAEALAGADVVLSSGGVSVGDFDFVKDVLAALGVEERFWRVAMKPGKPVLFGARGATLVFGLPGNPASSMVAFELFVRPALLRLSGVRAEACERPRAPVLLDEAYEHGGRRRHFLRARVRREGAVLWGRRHALQGSGMLRSMVGVNALLEIAEDAARIPAGATVSALLLEAM